MRLIVVVCLLVSVSACDAHRVADPTPGQPSSSLPPVAPSPVPPSIVTNWDVDALVKSSSGTGACGSLIHTGEARERVTWQVTTTGNRVELIEDFQPFPNDNIIFAGTLNGDAFDASENLVDLGIGARGTCDFRRSDLSGRFSADGLEFDATETMLWGPPEARTAIVRHWSGTRR